VQYKYTFFPRKGRPEPVPAKVPGTPLTSKFATHSAIVERIEVVEKMGCSGFGKA
jgi:hypothetical protein